MYGYKNTLALLSCFLCAPALANKQPSPVTTFFDYQLFQGQSKPLTLSSLPRQILEADVVLVGEWHSHSAVHRFQSDLYRRLLKENSKVTLSMEQFSRPSQKVLDQYLQGEIGELALVAHGNAWPNYTSDYRAIVEQAKSASMPVIAANAPRDIVRCIGKVGPDYLKQLDSEERKFVAAHLDTSDRPYKADFTEMMEGIDKDVVEKMYAAQVSWDETMAESIAMHLTNNPDHQVMHTAGKFHVEQGMGIAYSLSKRMPNVKIALITPVTESSKATKDSHFPEYQLLVLPLPEQRVTGAHDHGMSTHPHSDSSDDCK
ncbi:ChaN family lipoprotein [Vibrio comitans]